LLNRFAASACLFLQARPNRKTEQNGAVKIARLRTRPEVVTISKLISGMMTE
jgi:hypothetical protein